MMLGRQTREAAGKELSGGGKHEAQIEIPEGMTEKEFDQDEETGLYYFGARYLDPRTSRWVSLDPSFGDYLPGSPINDQARRRNKNLPGQGGVFNPINLALYHYAGNNPLKYIDPDGFNSIFFYDYGSRSKSLYASFKEQNRRALGFVFAVAPTILGFGGPFPKAEMAEGAAVAVAATESIAAKATAVITILGALMDPGKFLSKGETEGAPGEEFEPTEGQLKQFQKQLEEKGVSSLEKSKKPFEKRLGEHTKKLKEINKAGGFTSSIEREIRNFKQQINAIKDVLGK